MADTFFDEAARRLGERLGESRFDPDRGLRVTVLDLDGDDTAAITDIATSLGIADWVRIERADPDDLATWERLRHDLLRLSRDHGTLQVSPTPDPGYRRPPVAIQLFPGAQAQAAALHDAYGDFVELQVGALPYPLTTITSQAADLTEARDTADPHELTVALESPLSIPSGHTTTHAVILTNHSARDIAVHTNGTLTADIVDDHGTVVGGFVGPQILPLVVFTAEPTSTVRIPLLVGTASHTPALGYAIPPGSWHLTVPLHLADGRGLVSPPLPFTVTR